MARKGNLCRFFLFSITWAISGFMLGCTVSATPPPEVQSNEARILALPQLEPAELKGERLRVVVTTSIIGDVVSQIGGDTIELSVLIGTEQDPHSYVPVAQALTAASAAHIIFVNGWGLEETLIQILESTVGQTPIVPVAAGIEPMQLSIQDHQDGDEHSDIAVDPHTWFSIHNVEQWAKNVEEVLREIDPTNADMYRRNAEAYQVELRDLTDYVETKLADLPMDRRFLVTNHDSFGYFARDYGFQVLGAVIPSISALAEPSAEDLVGLVEKMEEFGICTIFTETTVNEILAQTVAAELDGCERVQVLPLYTGALGQEGSDADSYIGMFRANVNTIVRGLE